MAGKKASQDFNMTAITLAGLEEVLAQELRDLGAKFVKPGVRAVTFSGNQYLLYQANLCCRTAIRILKPFAQFKARDEKELYLKVRERDWDEFMTLDSTFAINAVVSRSTFEHSLYVAQLTKDAIVDQFRDKTGRRPNIDVTTPDVRLHLHMHENIVTLALDSSGDSLHRRGYRQQTNVAPLNEVLAAGILLLSGWDKKTALYDPMCGSGTFLTEAAMLAHNIAPGVYRKDFGFMRWPDYDEAMFHKVYQAVLAQEDPDNPVEIYGSDIDPDFVEAAFQNLEYAELDQYVRVKEVDFKVASKPEEKGLLIMNPPYGERIGDEREINGLYKMIGDTLKANFQNWDAFVFTGNLEAAKHIGLKPSRRIPLYNGPIECRLFKYELYGGSRREKEHLVGEEE
ncbi:THUMP domain-containing class I SAM-dependent RNA methyltransferase [Rufibacter ruber]|uniref:THUMP domain-containing class I SAM-dependent RNA methyltransferase n=1 Tax=Rufibacter ruber TaxID=1783499 RepID=UPI00082D07E3|nr:THUMP domain-containing protein [Rufibacter ruber]